MGDALFLINHKANLPVRPLPKSVIQSKQGSWHANDLDGLPDVVSRCACYGWNQIHGYQIGCFARIIELSDGEERCQVDGDQERPSEDHFPNHTPVLLFAQRSPLTLPKFVSHRHVGLILNAAVVGVPAHHPLRILLHRPPPLQRTLLRAQKQRKIHNLLAEDEQTDGEGEGERVGQAYS